MSLHQECKVLMEQISQCKARFSYLAAEHVQPVSGETVSYSRAKLRIIDDLSSLSDKVRETQKNMLTIVESLNQDATSTMLKQSSFRDGRDLPQELLQQTLLEMSLLDRLLQLDASDQDSVVTILTCFLYLPCITNIQEMEALGATIFRENFAPR